MTNIFVTPANFNRPLYQSQDFIQTLNIFPYYLSYLLLIKHKNFNFKHIFYFQKIVKGGPLAKTFQLLQNLTGYCTKVRASFELWIFLPYYLSTLLLIQHKNFNFKHIFYFLKSVKGGPLTKIFPTLANFNGPMYQSQDFIRTLNIFSIFYELPTID